MATGDEVLEMITGRKRPDVAAPEGADAATVARFEKAKTDCYEWDALKNAGFKLDPNTRPFGPSREGSRSCRCGSIASGGDRPYCTCDACF